MDRLFTERYTSSVELYYTREEPEHDLLVVSFLTARWCELAFLGFGYLPFFERGSITVMT